MPGSTTLSRRSLTAAFTTLCAAAAVAVAATSPAFAQSAPAPGSADPAPADRLAAVLPSPSGDPFFDDAGRSPEDLDAAAPGTELERRDVTAAAAPVIGAPIARATQFRFRTTAADGAPTYGTATLLEPPGAAPLESGAPLLVYDSAIDALGRRCTPGYSYAHGDVVPGASLARRVTDLVPPLVADALRAGTAVLVPDHEGPTMAYADPFTAGHTILDSLRTGPMAGAGRVVITGYSGGAIASLGAGKLAEDYAPDVAAKLAGVAIGGVPADFETLMTTMNRNLAVGLLGSATLGVGRAHPEMLDLLTDTGMQIATAVKDTCLEQVALGGATLGDLGAIAEPGALRSPTALRLYDQTRMSDRRVAAPLYLYQGANEFWIPVGPVRRLADEQRALGVDVTLDEVPGEHFLAALTGYPGASEWIGRTLRS